MVDRDFPSRHIGPDPSERQLMLERLGYDDLDAFTADVVPEVIGWHEGLDLPAAASEPEAIVELTSMAARNRLLTSMIGLGYSGTHTPAVIKRNILENPAWYTAYTPYQPEISQGRLEALLNFQTMVEDLTALPVAGSSLLDEPTAAAVPSSSSDAFATSMPVSPATMVWKLSSASRRPCAISA